MLSGASAAMVHGTGPVHLYMISTAQAHSQNWTKENTSEDAFSHTYRVLKALPWCPSHQAP